MSLTKIALKREIACLKATLKRLAENFDKQEAENEGRVMPDKQESKRNDWLLRLAVYFLRLYRKRLSGASCSDWDMPTFTNEEEVRAFLCPDEPEDSPLPDWHVASLLASKLEELYEAESDDGV